MKTENADGSLSSFGMTVVSAYAAQWLQRLERDLELEREYPELEGMLYDIRANPDLARAYGEEAVHTVATPAVESFTIEAL